MSGDHDHFNHDAGFEYNHVTHPDDYYCGWAHHNNIVDLANLRLIAGPFVRANNPGPSPDGHLVVIPLSPGLDTLPLWKQTTAPRAPGCQ